MYWKYTKEIRNNAWLAGFIDAEGCFMIKLDLNRRTVKLVFEITQKEEKVLNHIKKLLSFNGTVRKTKDYWVLSIAGKEQRDELIEYLNKYKLESHKGEVYRKWEEANGIIKRKEHHIKAKKEGYTRLKRLSENLNKWREEN